MTESNTAAHGMIRVIADAFSLGLERILGSKLHGVYVFGAAAFPDSTHIGDIDFHVILNDPLTGDERGALERLHHSLARRFPPLGGELDGYYILLKDARSPRPPRSQMWEGAEDSSWALHREHIRAGRCITLHGPDPLQIYPPASWAELEDALRSELKFVRAHLHDYPDYCILNLCRLMFSVETRDVVISKAGAAAWAQAVWPKWRYLIRLALKSYAKEASSDELDLMRSRVTEFHGFASLRFQRHAGVAKKRVEEQQP